MNEGANIYLKPLSKKWWENVWYYYKGFIIGGIIALAFIVFFLVECAMNVTADFTVTYIGGLDAMGQIQAYQLEDEFSAITDDIDGDGHKKASFNVTYLDKSAANDGMSAMFNSADIELAGGDSVVLLFDEEFLERYAEYGFEDLSKYVEEFNVDESLLKRYDDGRVYAIQMSANPVFTKLEDIDTTKLYLTVRPLRPNEKGKWQKKNYENGVRMARYIISGATVTP